MDLRDVLSPIRHTGFAVGERLDPFYDGLWAAGTRGVWASVPETRRQMEAGLGDLKGMTVIETDEALAIVLDQNNLKYLLPALGVIENMRTVTIEQLSAFTQRDYSTEGMRRLLSAAFCAGLIDIGRASDLIGNGISSIHGYLLRPAKGRARVFDKHVRRHLSLAEQVSVSGGLPYSVGGQFDRHNILATEMLLRAAEMLEVGTVVGEKYCTADMIFGSGIGRDPILSGIRSDAMIVREDGVRIAIEMTSTSNSHDMLRKVESWARHMDSHRFARNGVIVLFVVAPSFESNYTESALIAGIQKAVRHVLSHYRGIGRVSLAERFAISRWSSFFPSRDDVQQDFFDLTAKIRTGSGDEDAVWEPVNILTDDRYTEDFTFDAHAVISNLGACHQTPPWIRDRDISPDITEHILRQAPGRIPILPSTKKSLGNEGRWMDEDEALSSAPGAVGAHRRPKRLETLGA